MLSLALVVMLQDLPAPPAPKMGPPPPVGDVPIDSSIGVLIVAAVVIAFWVFRTRRLKDTL